MKETNQSTISCILPLTKSLRYTEQAKWFDNLTGISDATISDFGTFDIEEDPL